MVPGAKDPGSQRPEGPNCPRSERPDAERPAEHGIVVTRRNAAGAISRRPETRLAASAPHNAWVPDPAPRGSSASVRGVFRRRQKRAAVAFTAWLIHAAKSQRTMTYTDVKRRLDGK